MDITNVLNVTEHDYATYIISNAMQTDDGGEGESQIVYQVQEFLPDDHVEAVAVDDLTFDGEQYEFITTDAENDDIGPRYRREVSAGTSGYWNEDDVNRLLKVYLKHVKLQPNFRGRPNNATWSAICREFDTAKKFTKAQVRTKILRLRNLAKNFLKNGEAEKKYWPFWKPMMEILQLDNRTDDDEESQETTDLQWSNELIHMMLDWYLDHAKTSGKSKTRPKRNEVWDKIAESLGHPRYLVVRKFQRLKAKWERWKYYGSNNDHPMFEIFQKFNEIAANDVFNKQSGDETDSPAIPTLKFRDKWNRQETDRVLEIYVELLNELHSSRQVKTRRSIFKQISQMVNIPTQAIQVKITSLKGHYKKYLKMQVKERGTSWRYAKLMEQVAKLENLIWTQMDINVGDSVEPEWFKKYRNDVQERHDEAMSVFNRLLNVMQRILEA